jgi:hypothetical protein
MWFETRLHRRSPAAVYIVSLHRFTRKDISATRTEIRFLLSAGVLCALAATANLLFVSVRCTAVCDAPRLYVGGTPAIVSVARWNRVGFRVPFSHPTLRCSTVEGEDLVSLHTRPDSSAVEVRPRDRPGEVLLRVVTSASPVPLGVRISVVVPQG